MKKIIAMTFIVFCLTTQAFSMKTNKNNTNINLKCFGKCVLGAIIGLTEGAKEAYEEHRENKKDLFQKEYNKKEKID